jgi:hypothetical protein
MPIQINPTTQQQITAASRQLSQVGNELNQPINTGAIDQAQYNFFNKFLNAVQLLGIGI